MTINWKHSVYGESMGTLWMYSSTSTEYFLLWVLSTSEYFKLCTGVHRPQPWYKSPTSSPANDDKFHRLLAEWNSRGRSQVIVMGDFNHPRKYIPKSGKDKRRKIWMSREAIAKHKKKLQAWERYQFIGYRMDKKQSNYWENLIHHPDKKPVLRFWMEAGRQYEEQPKRVL